MIDLKITDVRADKGDSAFLIDDGKTAVMYDSGFAFTGYAVADKINTILKERKLDYIFLTHSHYDHAAGTPYALKYWPEAKVVAGEYAVKIFGKPTAKAVMRDLDKKHALKCGVTEYEDLIDELKVDISVKDGDKIKAGGMTFTALNLPGHTKCSIGYYLEENKLLLSCETLGNFDGTTHITPLYLVGVEMALNSIKKAKALEIENILIPHHGLLNKEQTKYFLENTFEVNKNCASEIATILKNGGKKEEAMKYFIETFYGYRKNDMPPIDALNLNTGIMVDLIEREMVNI